RRTRRWSSWRRGGRTCSGTRRWRTWRRGGGACCRTRRGGRPEEAVAASGLVEAEALTEAEWNVVVGHGAGLMERLGTMPVTLEDVTSRIFQGLKTGADKVYIV